MYGFIIVFILVAVSGFIAYFGDYLGRKIGKKKVTLFGLRPKHTSILITIVTGALITSLTIGVIMLSSTTARTFFFNLQKLNREMRETKSALARKSSEFDGLQKKLDKKNLEYTELQKKLQGDLKAKQVQLNDLTKEIEANTVQLNALKDSNAKLRTSNSGLEASNSRLESSNSELKSSNGRLKTEISGLDEQRNKLEQERTILVGKKEKLEKEIKAIATNVSDIQKVSLYGDIIYDRSQPLAKFIVSPDIGRSELEANIRDAVKVITDSGLKAGATVGSDADLFDGVQIDKVWQAVSRSRGDLVVVAVSATRVFKGEPLYVELRAVENKIVFKKGEVLASADVRAGADSASVENMLSDMISHITDLARARGILPDPRSYMVAVPRFSEAVSNLSGMKSGAKVELFAARDTRLADGLQIDYRIK